MNPAEYAIRNKLIGWIVVAIALIGGLVAYTSMPRLEDPEFTVRYAQIITDYPGATPQEVAEELSDKIETELQSMQEVEEIVTTNSYGRSIIQVEIKYEFSPTKEDLQVVWARMRNRIADAQAQFPPGAGEPHINDDFGDVYGLFYFVTGPGFTIKELYDYAWDLRTDLLSVENVAKVGTLGRQREAVYIEISRSRIAALGVSIDRLFADLREQNAVVSAGDVTYGPNRVQIQPTGGFDTVEAIGNTIVSAGNSGELIYLRDVATITRDYVDPPLIVTRFNGEPAIGLAVSNVSGSNIAQIGEDVRAKLAATLGERPIGVEVSEFYHQGDIVNASVNSFSVNVVLAIVIVLVTLLVFMGLKSAVIIGATLLITIAATVLTMSFVGIPLHRISLGALIIALGMLVDNAIVVAEGILVGTQQGRRTLEVAKEIVDRTKWALLGGTAVGIIAFAPIGFAPGSTAEYTNHLFWVILISLGYSWLFAVTLVPMLSDLLFRNSGGAQMSAASSSKPSLGARAMGAYKGFLRGVLGVRWAAGAAAVLVFAASVYGFGYVRSGFFPASTTPQFAIDYWLPEGTDINETIADIEAIEQHVLGLDGVVKVHSVIGAGTLRYTLIYSPQNLNAAYGQLLVEVDDLSRIPAMIPDLQSYLETNFPRAQPRAFRFQLGPGSGQKIQAAFSGPDPAVLRRLSNQALDILRADPRAQAVQSDWREPTPVIEPIYDPERGRRLGVSREALADSLAATFSGATVGVYREGDDLIPIVARAPEEERVDLASAGGIQIPSSRSGRTVPLSETLRDVDIAWRDGQLIREDRVWMIKAKADPLPGDLASDLFERVRPQIEAIELPEGYALRWDGEYGDSTEANGDLATTIPFGLLAMVLVVVFLFNALRQPLVIWLLVPMSIVGVVIGLLTTMTAMEFMAILGVLSLSGLLIKNAIVLVDQMDLEIREGKPRFDAVIDSAASRVRPVMMGALTTVLGVLPLMWDVFFKSMAVVIVFGLSFATILTLVLLPAFYAVAFRVKASETAQA